MKLRGWYTLNRPQVVHFNRPVTGRTQAKLDPAGYTSARLCQLVEPGSVHIVDMVSRDANRLRMEVASNREASIIGKFALLNRTVLGRPDP